MTQNEWDAEIAKARLSWGFRQRLADALVNFMTIAACAIPLAAFGFFVIEPLAGKKTVANIDIAVAITASLSLAVNVGQLVKGQERKRTILEQRETISDLESRAGLPSSSERRRMGDGTV